MNNLLAPHPRNFAVPELAHELDLVKEVTILNKFILKWLDEANNEIRPHLIWQLLSTPKYFRPITIFACYRSVSNAPVPARVIRSAVALEYVHNVSLIVDDILDRSRFRRGKLSLHCKFGLLPALMVAGYLYSGALKLVSNDPYSVNLLAELMQRLGIAECVQWRLRRQPLGVEDWRLIASEDTGSMFEICAKLGTRDDKLTNFGNLLGMLYHGCDDVADVRGDAKLGGTGNEDVRDGILTLPAAIAIRDLKVSALFRSSEAKDHAKLKKKFCDALGEAEKYLDGIAQEARHEAVKYSVDPAGLNKLIDLTRLLSGAQ